MRRTVKLARRTVLSACGAFVAAPVIAAAQKVRLTAFELVAVRATERTVWLIVRLRTDAGLSGLGEASDAFGFAKTTKDNALTMESELRRFFELVQGRSPVDIEYYRQAGAASAKKGGLISATAYSAVEQALWDLAAQSLEVPVHTMFGGKVRDSLPVYANINRAAKPRTPAGFAATAGEAVREGFRSVKAAPFDGFPAPGSPRVSIDAAVEQGIASVVAIREAIGPEIQLMIDCHSFFDVNLATGIARKLEPQNLAWYEEPVAPERTEETLEIRRAIRQPMAGGEVLFGIEGFAPLCRRRAVHVIMPDVKHCGGLLEMSRIAALADVDDIAVAPHNPSGPVATAASVQVCAGMKNFRVLEFQWGEVPWRSDLVVPAERFERGAISLTGRPGLGVRLNDRIAKQHTL
jgi:galactonate dehydratase